MKLRIYPDSVLRKKNSDITAAEIEELYGLLVTSMISYGGIGIAAPQIGISKNAAILSQDLFEGMDKPLMLINPRIIEGTGFQSIEEACLSVYGIAAYVPRNYDIKIETGVGDDRKVIELQEMPAIVAQHEIDHLNGILFPDRLKIPKRYWCLLKSVLKKYYGKKD